MTIAMPRLSRLPAAEKGITLADFLVPIRVGESLSSRARHIFLIAAGALFIFLTARISFPVPGSPIPVTGQTFGVLLVGGALGFRRGFAAVVTYVLLGLSGCRSSRRARAACRCSWARGVGTWSGLSSRAASSGASPSWAGTADWPAPWAPC